MPGLIVPFAAERAHGLASRVRVVVDLLLNDMRRNRILSIDKFAEPKTRRPLSRPAFGPN